MAYNGILTAPADGWADLCGGAPVAGLMISQGQRNPPAAEGVFVRFQSGNPGGSVSGGHFIPLPKLHLFTLDIGALGGRAWVRAATVNFPVTMFVTSAA